MKLCRSLTLELSPIIAGDEVGRAALWTQMAGRIRTKLARVNSNRTGSIFRETNKNSQKWVRLGG